MKTNTDEPITIRAREAARLLGISPRQVQKLAKDGKLPHRKAGTLYLFSPRTLRAWADGEQVDP